MITYFQKIFSLFLNKNNFELSVILSSIVFISCLDLLIIGMLYNFLLMITGSAISQSTIILPEWRLSIYHQGIILMVLISTLGLIKLIYLWYIIKFAQSQRVKISSMLLRIYTNSFGKGDPKFNKQEIVKLSISEVDLIVSTIFYPACQVLANITTSLLLVSFLLIKNPAITLLIIVFASVFYALVYKITSARTDKLTKKRDRENTFRHSAILNYAQHLREIIIENRMKPESDKIQLHTAKMSDHLSNILNRSQMTRYIIEPLVFLSLISVLLLIYFDISENRQVLLSQAGIFVYAIMKILPAAQAIYQTLIQFKIGAPTLNKIITIYETAQAYLQDYQSNTPIKNKTTIVELITSDLKLQIGEGGKKVMISYPKMHFSIGHINLIKGPSGSGKSSYFDYLLGFLTPKSGIIKITDNTGNPMICENVRSEVAYVPQFPQLIGGNLMEMLGCKRSSINDAEDLLEKLGLEKYIDLLHKNEGITNFSDKFSGGEIQRLCLARGILRQKSIYLLDEVTSALDQSNQEKVLNILNDLSKNTLVIMITHKSSADVNCKVTML